MGLKDNGSPGTVTVRHVTSFYQKMGKKCHQPAVSICLACFFKQKTEFSCLDALPVCCYLPENKARVHSFPSGSLHSPALLSAFKDLLRNIEPYQEHEMLDAKSFDTTPTDSKKLWTALLRFIPMTVRQAKISCLNLS